MRNNCLDDTELSTALKKLTSANSNSEQQSIVNRLMDGARKSALCRKRLISSLMTAMDRPNLDLARDRESFYIWHYGSKMLSDLRATEALDFLIAHFNLHDGTDFPLNHHPAMAAVVRMGKIAVPNLDSALRTTADPVLRRYVVFCLGWVGGASVQKILTRASAVETDACVRTFIASTLEALNNRQHQITPANRLRWYASIRCKVQ